MPNPNGAAPLLLNPKLWFTVALIMVMGIAIRLFSFSTYEEKEDQQFQDKFNHNYQVFSLNLPEEIAFAGETVPIEKLDLRERLDRELLVNTYWQSQTLLFFKRAHKWFPVIEPILAANGVPDDFKYLALIESGLDNVVSPSGAAGFWQFMKPTGKEYELEINGEVDERYHLEKATMAACEYLKAAKAKFGSWTMAAASYNMGIPGLAKQLDRQRVSNYYDLLLGNETSRYVFRMVAVKEILSQPKKYGFQFRSKDLYPPVATRTITLDTAVADFAVFAQQQGINYKVLKLLNPWLRKPYLNNKKGTEYLIQLPKAEFVDQLIVDPIILKDSVGIAPDSGSVSP